MNGIERRRAQAVVIGSGPGGAVSAALLAEAGVDVTVCEEGDWVEHGSVPPFSLDQMRAQYRHAGLSATLGRPPIAYAEGRCAGGGSEVNSGLYHRPPEHLVASWRRDYRINELNVADLYKTCEAIEGDLSVSCDSAAVSAASKKLAQGAAALDWAATEVPRWQGPADSQAPGRRTMTRTYLPRATDAGASVLTDVRVDRIVHDGGRVSGVACTVGPDSRQLFIDADRVVVAAGAIQTPALLLRSGIRRGVGRTLRVHPTIKAVARFDNDVNQNDVAVHQVKEFAPDLSFGGSVSSPGQIALTLADGWAARRHAMEDWPRLAVYYAAIRPEGVGRVRVLRGARDPIVTYSLTARDLTLLGSGLARLSLLLLAAGAHEVWPSIRNAPSASRPAEIPDMVRGLARGTASLMTIHLFSSVPMGERPDCPVDSFGRVKGIEGLYVGDASLLPTAPGVNPQGSIMALAYRNAQQWLETGEVGG